MKSHTEYMTFETEGRRELIRITEDVQAAVDAAGIEEGMALVSAMHITAGVWVNDDEPGLHEDVLEWLDKVAPASWQPPPDRVAEDCCPTAATTATIAVARTTATPTSRTCSSTTRRSSRSPPAASTSVPGSRSSTASSTAAGRSAW